MNTLTDEQKYPQFTPLYFEYEKGNFMETAEVTHIWKDGKWVKVKKDD